MKTIICSSIFLFAGFILSYTDGQGFGTDGTVFFNCPIPPKKFKVATDLISKLGYKYALLPCDQDCVFNHRAKGGSCDEETSNCICTYEGEEQVTDVPLVYSSKYCQGSVCQCGLKEYTEFYNLVCEGDCKCNHGATDWACDYEKKMCQCLYDENKPYNSSICPINMLVEDPLKFNEVYGKNNTGLNLLLQPNWIAMTFEFLTNLQGQDTPGFIETLNSPLIAPNSN